MKSKIYKLVLVILASLSFRASSLAEEKDHSNHESHDEKTEEGHEDHDDEKEEESSSAVGPEKGITEKSRLGFKFSPEAQKTIGYKTAPFSGVTFTADKDTLVRIKSEKSIYRIRDGWIKRIPTQVMSSTGETVTLKSTDLKAGDQIIVTQTGYIRIAEIFSDGGASHGHSH